MVQVGWAGLTCVFVFGLFVGAYTGILLMALMQINRLHRKDNTDASI